MDFKTRLEEIGLAQYIGILTALISAAVHLYLAPSIGLNFLGISFLFAGVGFLVGIALVLLNYRRKLVYLLGIPFTAGQVISWYYINRIPLETLIQGEPFLDVLDKSAQIILVITLIYLSIKEGR